MGSRTYEVFLTSEQYPPHPPGIYVFTRLPRPFI
jgi:hypothetical protein